MATERAEVHRARARMASVLVAAALLAGCTSGTGGQTAPAQSGATQNPATSFPLVSEQMAIPAPSLANNLIGDPAELNVRVLLPSDYNSASKRYPTVYFLMGFGDGVGSLPGLFGTATMTPTGSNKSMIVVGVDGVNGLYGSFYRNSPVTGNWEDAIIKDLVTYVDKTYRTIPDPKSRGIAGHSMGGSGAWELAIRHPDVFGAVDAIAPGLTDDKGVTGTQMFAAEATIKAEMEALAPLDAKTAEQTKADWAQTIALTGSDVEFALAYGAVFSPDTTAGSLIKFPYKDVDGKLVADATVMHAWNEGYGNQDEKVARYKDNLAKLHGIQIEYGTYDEYGWIPIGCKYLDGVLTKANVPHKTIEFEGSHSSDLVDRVQESVIPFFSSVLEG